MHFEMYMEVFIGYWILKRAGFLSGLLFFIADYADLSRITQMWEDFRGSLWVKDSLRKNSDSYIRKLLSFTLIVIIHS